jgi:1,4-alpha-glucan branching enzyme
MAHFLPTIVKNDPWLAGFKDTIIKRHMDVLEKEKQICKGGQLKDFATGHLYYGLHNDENSWIFREWAPNAIELFLVGDFSSWLVDKRFQLKKLNYGNWEIKLPIDLLNHRQQYKLLIKWQNGEAYRLPSYANRVVQDDITLVFNAEIWFPENKFQWRNPDFAAQFKYPLVYEAHVGMASAEEKVASFNEFTTNILPRIKSLGYNTIQLMAIQEHPYYGSFGYHVSNFFAVSSRFGTPDDFKSLIDTAHGMGIAVIMDLVHSHSVKNENEGLGMFDGTPYQYFHDNRRRIHVAWDSLCFNYKKNEVLHFLLSNCQYWLTEYKVDGFRFDGVTSMLYLDHGLGKNFTDYSMYYDNNQDEDAIVYLTLANKLIHEIKPKAITIAEEMSGMPGLGAPLEQGGYGFDFRLAMGVPDYWIKLIKELSDEKWNVNEMYHELISHRSDEQAISYTESHDQALVGDKTIFFRLTDKEMYFSMSKNKESLIIDRGIALHKMIRLITIATAGSGYLNFMGNEFGHPEWIDFPREGNNWSYNHARRQWNLADDLTLKYHWLLEFDKSLIELINDTNIFEESFPKQPHADENNQVLAFRRKEYLFVFNFNPNKSFTDYHIPVDAGKYQVMLSTDDFVFGGQERIDKNYVYYTTAGNDFTTLKTNHISIYIPSRTGIVLKKQLTKTVYST